MGRKGLKMINSTRKFISNRKDLLLLVGIVFLISLIIFSIYFLNNIPFEYGGDLKRQYYPFFIEFEELIKNFVKTGTMPFYSWNMFLGTNFWASKTFYMLSDVFAYLTAIIPANFLDANMMVLIIKNCVGAATFYYLLNEFGYKSKTKIVFSILYVFSAWMMCFIEHTMFISFYVWVPLYFLGIERYLKRGKATIFSFSVIILFLTNYYLMFPLALLSPIYFIYRYINVIGTRKGFIKCTLRLVGVYLLSFGVTAVFMYPTILYILDNERIGDFYVYWKFWIVESYYHLIQGLFIPNQLYLFSPDNLYDTMLHNTRELALFAGTITSLLIPQFLVDKDKKFRFTTIGLYLVIIFIIFTPISNIILMGFGDLSFRWTFIIIIINLLIAARYYDREIIDKRVLMITVAIAIIINLGALPLMFYHKGMIASFSISHFMYQLSIVSAIMFVLFGIVLMLDFKYKKYVILGLVCIEVTLCNYNVFSQALERSEPSYDISEGVSKVLQDYKNGLNNALRAYDEINNEQFYRVFIDYDSLLWSYSYNANLFYQTPSLMTYDTTLAPSLNKTAEWFPELNTFNVGWAFNIKEANYINFLSTKYAIVTSKEQLPHQDFTLIDDNFRWGLLVYENNKYRSIGVTYNKIMSESEFEKKLDSQLMLDTVISKQSTYDLLKSNMKGVEQKELEEISYYGNQLHGKIILDSKSIMVMSIPYDKGWKVLINGKEVDAYNVNGGFMAFVVNEGINQIDMYFAPVGFKEGVVISLSSFALLSSILIYNRLKERRN